MNNFPPEYKDRDTEDTEKSTKVEVDEYDEISQDKND